MAEKKSVKFEGVYSRPGNAPWTYSKTPPELKELISSGKISRGMSVLEVGCGEGHQAVFLRKKGLVVTAVDSSKNAINYAKENASRSGVTIYFKQMSYNRIKTLRREFDFIFDWRFLHELTSESQRENYLKDVNSLLKKDGKYLSVSFSGDSNFMGTSKIRKSPVGIPLYFAKLKGLEKLIKKHFQLIKSKHIFVPQKPGLKIKANYVYAGKYE